MQVFVNEQPYAMPAKATLAELLRGLAPLKPFAVGCNGEFVPAASFHSFGLNANDSIEIVHPAAGG